MKRLIERLRCLVAPLSVTALCLGAARPWFKLEAVCSDDFSFHLLRLVQLDSLLRQGLLYSRWAPDMALSYGYPIFNFYAPLSYYIAAAFGLAGIDLRIALILTFACAAIAAGLAAYLLTRDHFSSRSALVAAAAYAYAPYLAYDAFFRANLAETLAWVFLPLALWAMGRLSRRGGSRYLALAALAYAAVLLIHNIFALIFSPLLAAYGLSTAFILVPASSRRRRLALVCVALLLGLGLSAFFWLPALMERAYIHSDRLLVPPIFVYWNNFIDWRELLAAPRTIHPDLLNPSPPRALGLIPVLLGLPALLGLWRLRDRPRRLQIAFFAVAALAYAWLTTASSRFIWDSVPLLEYIQFPWRLLGPAALCLAVLIAATVELVPSGRRRALIAAAAAVLLIGNALFWLAPRYCPGGEDTAVASIASFEQATHTIGTTAKGEYLPHTVAAIPQEPAVTPLDPASLPAGTTVAQRRALPVGADLVITATQPFTAVYNGFDYPGWRVTVNDVPVPITPETTYGRITFPVPSGYHRISVQFGETSLRRMSDLLSLACLALALFLGLFSTFSEGQIFSKTRNGVKRHPAQPDPSSVNDYEPSSHEEKRLSHCLSWAWVGWGLALLAAIGLLHRVDTPLCRPGLQDGARLGLDSALYTPFEGGLTLLGFNRERAVIPSAGRLRLDLFWKTREPPAQHYQRSIALLGPDGLRWSLEGSLPPRNFREPPRTQLWPLDAYVQDSHYVETLPGTPPGVYDLRLTLFERETLAPMRVLQEDGRLGSPAFVLGQITVNPPQHPLNLDETAMQYPLDADLGPLMLLGFDQDRAEAAPGDPVRITTFWRADQQPACDLTAYFSLLAPDGDLAAEFDFPPTFDSHPTSVWRSGDVWRGQHLLHLPAALDDGDYTWRLSLRPAGRSVDLPASIHVVAPSHTFTPPSFRHPVSITLGETAALVGFDRQPEIVRPGDTLTTTLVWRAEAETHTSYSVFLHLIGSGGALVAQSDGLPAAWGRPTTGWLPGEYITDVHVLSIPSDIPPGDYMLSTGMYAGDARLTTPDGADIIPLFTFTVEAQ